MTSIYSVLAFAGFFMCLHIKSVNKGMPVVGKLRTKELNIFIRLKKNNLKKNVQKQPFAIHYLSQVFIWSKLLLFFNIPG